MKPLHFIPENSQQSSCGRDIFANGMKATLDKCRVTCLQCLKSLDPSKSMKDLRNRKYNNQK